MSSDSRPRGAFIVWSVLFLICIFLGPKVSHLNDYFNHHVHFMPEIWNVRRVRISHTTQRLPPYLALETRYCLSFFPGIALFFSRLTRIPVAASSSRLRFPCRHAPYRRFYPVFRSLSEIWNARRGNLHPLTTLVPF